MGLTATDVIIIVVSTILSLITILLIIWEAEEQMFVFGLRPSESISTDIAGLLTLAKGLSGDVRLSYSNFTGEMTYNITIKDKLICVTAASIYTATDCSSFPIRVDEIERTDVKGFEVLIKKSAGEFTVDFVD